MTTFTVGRLRCEYLDNPLGIDVTRPRLSWQIFSDRRGARQTAYRIVAASSADDVVAEQNLLWDSGRVESDQSIHVAYHGGRLRSRQRVFWRVQVWDEQGHVAVSPVAWWEMGLLRRSDWSASWIGASLVGGRWTTIPAPFLRRSFTLNAPVAQARLYITALGLYECTINGQRVGQDFFTPGWTDYRRRVQYQVYDVTDLLREGENVIGAILGDGWYCGHVAWAGRQNYGDRPKLLAQLMITYANGSTQTIVSNRSWRYAFGPILESDILHGESYDARLEFPGWNMPGFDDSSWQPVELFTVPDIALVAMRGPTVRRHEELRPIKPPTAFRSHQATRWVFDLGQNMVGWVRLRVQGPAGTTVTIRHAEVLNPDGTIYTANLRSARATDHYTLRGEGEEIWEPRFTFHGFRYVELSGYPGVPDIDAVTGIVVHSAAPPTGEFSCSDPLINQLQHNIVWSQKGNLLEVPTDCPQRDERLGWTGDAQVFVRTAAFNMNVAPFFTKWTQDLEDAQNPEGAYPPVAPLAGVSELTDGGPAWADAGIICPWTIYLCYGDTRLLETHYPSMQRFIEYLERSSCGFIRCYEDYPGFRGFGDWLALDGSGKVDGGTAKDLIGTAFFAYCARLMSRIAAILGHQRDAARYRRLFERVRQAFIKRYVTGAGRVAGETQTGYVLALHFDLLPPELRPAAAEALARDILARDTHLSTGFVGTPYLLHVLTAAGRLDLAYALLFQRTWPSWLYPVTQGATTIWERWDGWTHDKGFQDPGMNSFNHYAYGAIGEWLYSTVAGIDVDLEQPGYRHLILRPRPGGGLTAARAALETMYGRAMSAWRIDDHRFTWEIVVPPNTTATAYVPAPEGTPVRESGILAEEAEGVTLVQRDEATAVYRLAAGSYTFTVG
ncbi:MAG: glycoside hydrolase family 78 protein [Roseiflexus sp.]|nr:glycoside hydrolase family 78 protein [Roseiflexus sp.]MCS7288017.1 glycoside hydrolase family 78 protein [Roseiflexus sp.]MDW8232922.1 family 78 glycoside hydrolase catalytic domain [Roseiflexaceae bacterium]